MGYFPFAEFTEMDPTVVNGKRFTPKTYPEMADYSCHEMGEIVSSGVGVYATSAVTEQTAYVRETSVDSNPYIIIYGEYDGQSYYYKLDFMVSGLLANVLRNFSYNFTIKSVTKAGYTDENEAKKQQRGENGGLSFDAGTQSLLNISDGAGQLFVSATTAVLVNTNTYYLMYKYIPDINKPKDKVNEGVSHDAKPGDVISKIKAEGTVGDTNTSGAEFADYAGYNYIAITPNTPGNTIAMQKIVITNNGNLTRTVTLYLQKPYQMSVNAYDGDDKDQVVPEELNQKVWVDVTIPSDIEEALFPLEFVFEAAEQSLYPDATANNMPVRSGTSIIRDKTETTFGFVYTLTWDAYDELDTSDDGKKTFKAKFLTNKAASASDVYVYNEYFATGNNEFTNGGDPHYWTGTLKFKVVAGENFGNSNSSRIFDIYIDSSRQTEPIKSVSLKSGETQDVELEITKEHKLTEYSSIYFYEEYKSGFIITTTYVCNQSETILALLGGKKVILNFN